MNRRSILALALGVAAPALVEAKDGKKLVVEDRLTPEAISLAESTMVIASNARDDSDWTEIISRLCCVLIGVPLSEEARLRTNARANSSRPDHILFIGDVTPAKRILCVAISRLNDRNVNKSRDA